MQALYSTNLIKKIIIESYQNACQKIKSGKFFFHTNRTKFFSPSLHVGKQLRRQTSSNRIISASDLSTWNHGQLNVFSGRSGSRGGGFPPKTYEKNCNFCTNRKNAFAIKGHCAVHCFVAAVLWRILPLSHSSEHAMRLDCQILLKPPRPP